MCFSSVSAFVAWLCVVFAYLSVQLADALERGRVCIAKAYGDECVFEEDDYVEAHRKEGIQHESVAGTDRRTVFTIF
mgnify:CR=1 FL=1